MLRLFRRGPLAPVAWFACAISLLLTACGGGGGDGGPKIPPGSFTLSGNSASFTARQGAATPATQTFTITLTGSGATFVGAAYTNGQTQPAWLNVAITGSGSNYVLSVSVNPASVGPGQYTSTFAVGTADASGNVLQRQDFAVSFTLNERLTITTAAINDSFIFGDTRRTSVVPIAVRAPGRDWTLTSSAAWLQVPTATQNGNQTPNATIDVNGLQPGTYTATLRAAVVADATDSATLSVVVAVSAPVLSVSSLPIPFGGNNGRAGFGPEALQIALSAGQASHPFTVTLTTDSGGAWLVADRTSGSVGASGTSVALSANRSVVRGGTYTGQVRVSVNVNGLLLEQTRAITLNLEAHRLVASTGGVGLSQLPGRSVLQRTLKVYSNLGSTTTAWNAVSDASWLTVTSAGTTGGDLTVTANPAGLASDTVHYANVTISSPDAAIENQQIVRVGLALRSTAASNAAAAVTAEYLAASPVDPVFAVSNGGTDVVVYDAYSGTPLRTLANVAARAGSLAFSDNGRTLFVFDRTALRVNGVDPVTGAQTSTFDSTALSPGFGVGTTIGVIRPDGYPMLITPSGRIFDLATGTQYNADSAYSSAVSALSYSRSPDQTLVVTHGGNTARLTRSALAGGRLDVQNNVVIVSTAQGREGEACVSAAGDRIYTASGAPYEFPATSIATGTVIQVLPGSNYPNSMQCVWYGLVIGGIDGYYSENDIFVYYGPTGSSRVQLSSNGLPGAYRSSLARGLAVSADGTRLLSAWMVSPGSLTAAGLYFHTLPTPQ